jgi:hypothetical protein
MMPSELYSQVVAGVAGEMKLRAAAVSAANHNGSTCMLRVAVMALKQLELVRQLCWQQHCSFSWLCCMLVTILYNNAGLRKAEHAA